MNTSAPLRVDLATESADGFGVWVSPHWPMMAALARRLSSPGDWEDVLQESLSSAWRKRSQFDGERGSARNWLLAITADQARKSHRRVRLLPLPAGEDRPAPAGDAALGLDLDRSIEGLSGRQQLAVSLHYFLDLPIAEVAAVMGCSEGTVKSTLADARGRMRTQLGEDYR